VKETLFELQRKHQHRIVIISAILYCVFFFAMFGLFYEVLHSYTGEFFTVLLFCLCLFIFDTRKHFGYILFQHKSIRCCLVSRIVAGELSLTLPECSNIKPAQLEALLVENTKLLLYANRRFRTFDDVFKPLCLPSVSDTRESAFSVFLFAEFFSRFESDTSDLLPAVSYSVNAIKAQYDSRYNGTAEYLSYRVSSDFLDIYNLAVKNAPEYIKDPHMQVEPDYSHTHLISPLVSLPHRFKLYW